MPSAGQRLSWLLLKRHPALPNVLETGVRFSFSRICRSSLWRGLLGLWTLYSNEKIDVPGLQFVGKQRPRGRSWTFSIKMARLFTTATSTEPTGLLQPRDDLPPLSTLQVQVHSEHAEMTLGELAIGLIQALVVPLTGTRVPSGIRADGTTRLRITATSLMMF